MGQSTDAILFFGIDLPEDTEFPWGDANDFDEWLAESEGVKKPTEEYSEKTNKQYSEYWEKARNIEKNCIAQLVSHCSGDYPMYALTIKDTEVTAYRGSVESIHTFNVDANKILEFISFLRKHNIPHDEKNIGWKLVSWWG